MRMISEASSLLINLFHNHVNGIVPVIPVAEINEYMGKSLGENLYNLNNYIIVQKES